MIAALVLAALLAAEPPPTCAPTDFDCLKDWVVYEHYRADTAEQNLDDAQKALERQKRDAERCQKATTSNREAFGWGVAAGALLAAGLIAALAH